MALTNTTQFLADVRRQGMIPNVATLGNQDSDILRYADLELEARILPLMLSVNEEYNTQTYDVVTVGGQQEFRVPPRSIAGKLRDIKYIIGATRLPLPRIEIENLPSWTLNATGVPSAFYLKAGSVNLVPTPGNNAVLRMQYFCNHGSFVNWGGTTNAVAAVISGATYSTTTVPKDTLNLTIPAGFTPVVGQKYDVISSRTPYEHLAIGVVCLTGGLTPTFQVSPVIPNLSGPPSGLSPNIQQGDILVGAESMPIVPLPPDIQQLLVMRTVISVLTSIGDIERVAASEELYANLQRQTLNLYTPRVDGAPKKMGGALSKMTGSGFFPGFKVW